MLQHFETCTDDMVGVRWSPRDETLCVWENCLRYGVALYSIAGELLGRFSAYDQALGVKAVAWSPTGQLMAAGSYDQKVSVVREGEFANSGNWPPLNWLHLRAHAACDAAPFSLLTLGVVVQSSSSKLIKATFSIGRKFETSNRLSIGVEHGSVSVRC